MPRKSSFACPNDRGTFAALWRIKILPCTCLVPIYVVLRAIGFHQPP